MKAFLPLFVIVLLGGFLPGCTEDPLSKTKDFTPEVLNYEFYIEGEIDHKLLRYGQLHFDENISFNKYLVEHQKTWLMTYADSISEFPGYWEIHLNGVDITNIDFPYQLQGSEGVVLWYDQRIDALAEKNPYCQQGTVSNCAFLFTSEEDSITLISNENNILEGIFSGRAVLRGIGFTPYHDDSIFHDIVNGKFRIKYREE
jgi:hypothetical protein